MAWGGGGGVSQCQTEEAVAQTVDATVIWYATKL